MLRDINQGDWAEDGFAWRGPAPVERRWSDPSASVNGGTLEALNSAAGCPTTAIHSPSWGLKEGNQWEKKSSVFATWLIEFCKALS